MARRLASSLGRLPSHACRNAGDLSIAFHTRRTVKQSTATWHCRVPQFNSYCVRLARLRSSVDNGKIVGLRSIYRSSSLIHRSRRNIILGMTVHPSNSRKFCADTRGPTWNDSGSRRSEFYKRSSQSVARRVSAEGEKAEDNVADKSESSDFLTLPTVLTLVRVVAVPFIIPGESLI